MRLLNILALVIAGLLVLGEVARFWGSPRFIPMAVDELLLAALLLWAVYRPRRGALWHIVAWSSLNMLMLVLLVETADHQIHGPVKQAAAFYFVALGGLLAIGLFALRRALALMAARLGI